MLYSGSIPRPTMEYIALWLWASYNICSYVLICKMAILKYLNLRTAVRMEWGSILMTVPSREYASCKYYLYLLVYINLEIYVCSSYCLECFHSHLHSHLRVPFPWTYSSSCKPIPISLSSQNDNHSLMSVHRTTYFIGNNDVGEMKMTTIFVSIIVIFTLFSWIFKLPSTLSEYILLFAFYG